MGLELLHLSYVKRWVVAPTHREQSVAEHTFRVGVIAQHIAHELDLGLDVRYALFEMVMEHDGDERLTGDIPGPKKSLEMGYMRDVGDMTEAECVLKVADSIETGTFWLQWGNPQAWTGHPYNRAPARDIEKINHYAAKIPGLEFHAKMVWCQILGMDLAFDPRGSYPW